MTWEIAEQANLGLETKFFNGLFGGWLISITKFVITCWLTVGYSGSDGLGLEPLDNIG